MSTSNERHERITGWHGKLPSLGDFATRRLDGGFIERWDGWLAQGLAQLQQEPGWLERYLHCPAWRFLLMPGVVDARAWCGVLMPSVDRVGRYYPLTLAVALDGLPAFTEAAPLVEWLGHLEQAAYLALDEEWDVETFETRLRALGHPAPEVDATPVVFAWHAHLKGKACWYAAPAEGSARLLVSQGLEAGALAGLLFSQAPAAGP